MGGQTLVKVSEIAEVAEQLGASADTVRRLATIGELPTIRFGEKGHMRVRPEDVAEFVERNRKAAA